MRKKAAKNTTTSSSHVLIGLQGQRIDQNPTSENSCKLFGALTSVVGVFALSLTPQLQATSGTWNGTTDGIWATGTNWSTNAAPGTGATATFNNAGNSNTVINLGAGVTISSLVFDTSNIAAYTIGSGAVGSQALTLNDGGSIVLNNTIANNQLINANVALGTSATFTNSDTSNTLTIAGGITGAGSNLTKTGVGTLILSGLSKTASSNYTGTTILGGGTLAITSNASFSGGFTFGENAGSVTHSTLNLDNASTTLAGTMLVQTSSTSLFNDITIGSGQTLTNNGNVHFSGADSSARSRLRVTGSGSWNIITSNGTFGGVSGTSGNEMVVDLSGLSAFNANLRTGGSGSEGGVFRIGGLGGHTNNRQNHVSLATNSTISADSVTLGSGGNLSQNTLSLGNGTQIINSDEIVLGTGTRDTASTISFRTGDGTLKIRGTDGGDSTRSNLKILQGVSTGAAQEGPHLFDVTAHQVDLRFGTVAVYNSTASTIDANNISYNAAFSFDRGTLDASTFIIGNKTVGSQNNAGNAIANIGSSSNFNNTATLGTVQMGNHTTTAGGTANGSLNSTLNITGQNTGVTFATWSMANSTTNDAYTKVVSEVNISGGTTTGTGGIDMAAALVDGSLDSTLNITGGSLSVGTGGVSGTNGIYRTATTGNATLVLNGGSLDLNGNAIGGTGANAITTRFESGTLRNVSEINGGAGLTKTTAGTLVLSGTNTYTGTTNVSAGTLRVNGSIAGGASVDSGATLGGSGTIGGDVTISGTHSPGNSPGLQVVQGNLTYASGSLFDWELTSNTTAGRGTNYDAVDVGGDLTVASDAVFNIILNSSGSTVDVLANDGFWTQKQSWNVFDVTGSIASVFQNFTVTVDSKGQTYVPSFSSGGFSMTGGNLEWNPVPEVSSTLVGFLLGGLILRRRREPTQV